MGCVMTATPAVPTASCRDSSAQRLIPGLGNAVNQPNQELCAQVGFAWDPQKEWQDLDSWRNRPVLGERHLEQRALRRSIPRSNGRLPAVLRAVRGCGEPPPSRQSPTGAITPSAAVCGRVGRVPVDRQRCCQRSSLFQRHIRRLRHSTCRSQQSGLCRTIPHRLLRDGSNCFFAPGSMFNPNYRSPRSVQMNIGYPARAPPGYGAERRLRAQRADPLPTWGGSESRRRHSLLQRGCGCDCDRKYACKLRKRNRKWRGWNLFG
jgi:hypothetical protein